MKRPTQGGLLGIIGMALLLSMPHFLPTTTVKRTLVLFCNRRRTNVPSLRPDIPKWSETTKITGKRLEVKHCFLEGRLPKRTGGFLPMPVTLLSCTAPEPPLQLNVWEKITPSDKFEIGGWEVGPPYRPTSYDLGYYYQEYRLVLR
jgi:hypothetical protein